MRAQVGGPVAPWEESLSRLFRNPRRVTAADGDKPLPLEYAALGMFLRSHGVASEQPTWSDLMNFIAKALDYADRREPSDGEPLVETSPSVLREGVRGNFFLPRFGEGATPTDEDYGIVNVTKRLDGRARRWAGLRMYRARGAIGRKFRPDMYDPESARSYGLRMLPACVERLIEDLKAYAQPEPTTMPGTLAELGRPNGPGAASGATVASAAADVRRSRLAAHLDRVPRFYPGHLTNRELNKSLIMRRTDAAGELITPSRDGFASSRRVVLLGDPGAGKSTVLRAVAAAVLNDMQQSPLAFVRLAEYGREAASRMPRDLESAIHLLMYCSLSAVVTEPSADLVNDATAEFITRSDALLLLDGFDEVIDPVERMVATELVELLREFVGSVVMTSRHTDHVDIPGWDNFEMRSMFTPLTTLAAVWYPNDKLAQSFVSYVVKNNEILKEAASSPLMASLVLVAAQNPQAFTEPDHQRLDFSTGAIFEKAVAKLLHRDWKQPGQPGRAEKHVLDIQATCEQAAWIMAAGDPAAPSVAAYDPKTTLERLSAHGVNIEQVRASDLFSGDMVSAATSPTNVPVFWVHRSFQDYFAAKKLHRWWKDDSESAARFADDAILHTEWLHCMTIWLGLLPEGDSASVVSRWLDLAAAGDPGNIITLHLAEVVSGQFGSRRNPPSRLINRILAVGGAWLAHRLQPDFLRVKGQIVTLARYLEDSDFDCRMFQFTDPSNPQILRKLVPIALGKLRARLPDVPASTPQALEWISRHDVDAVAEFILVTTRQGVPITRDVWFRLTQRPSESIVKRLHAAVDEADFPLNMAVALCLGPQELAEHPVSSRNYRLAAWAAEAAIFKRRIHDGPDPDETGLRALRGDDGDFAALTIGRLLPAGWSMDDVTSPWAQLGVCLRDMVDAEVPVLFDASTSVEEARAHIRDFDNSAFESPEVVSLALRAAVVLADNGEADNVGILLDLLGRLDHHSLGPLADHLFIATLVDLRAAFTSTIENLLAQQLPAALWTAIQGSLTSSAALRPRHMTGLLEHATSQGVAGAELDRLVRWVRDTEPRALSSLNRIVAGRSEHLMHMLCDDSDPEQWSASVRDALAVWLTQDGALSRWRRTLVAVG